MPAFESNCLLTTISEHVTTQWIAWNVSQFCFFRTGMYLDIILCMKIFTSLRIIFKIIYIYATYRSTYSYYCFTIVIRWVFQISWIEKLFCGNLFMLGFMLGRCFMLTRLSDRVAVLVRGCVVLARSCSGELCPRQCETDQWWLLHNACNIEWSTN